jgi:PAB1-binding protein PBP1
VAESLEDFGNANKKTFNQFEGKQTSYDERLYTSTLDTTKIT